MLLFCPECGSSLQVEEGSNCYQFNCHNCPYVHPVTKIIRSRHYPKLKDLDEVLGGPSAWENAQITDERCPRCSGDRAYFMQLQTRSADEPMTVFYRCANSECAHRMVLQSFLSSGYMFLQFIIFYGVWIVFIGSVFIVVRLLFSRHLCSTACNMIAFAIASSLIFQLVRLYSKGIATRKMILDRGSPIDCMSFLWFIGPLSSHSCSEYYEALQSNIFWQLNVLHVSGTLLKDILVLITSMFGGALGEFLQSFISKLHWLYHIPVFVVLSLCVLLSVLAFFGYHFNLFYGLIRINFGTTKHAGSTPLCDSIKQLPEKKFVECRNEEINSLLLVNELYQKAHNYAAFSKFK